jgi:hypothetical protein
LACACMTNHDFPARWKSLFDTNPSCGGGKGEASGTAAEDGCRG